MLEIFHKYRVQQPLLVLLVLSFLPRLIAMIFSKGYGMHDDHFLIIEAAQSWVDDYDYNKWLPQNQDDPKPTGHSWFYVGLHYFLLQFLEFIGITGPQLKMFFIRFIHGSYSLLSIPPLYYICRKISNDKVAFDTTLIFGLLWFLPILSVRNLVELVCVPPLLWATWLLFKDEKTRYKSALFAGLLMGVAMAVRFHMSLFFGGMGLVLLFRKEVIQSIVFGLGFILAITFTQVGDLVLWGAPFVEITEYVNYNLGHKTTYFNAPWYQYIGTVAGLLLPPLGAIWFFFFFKGWKKYAMLFWPCLIFFLFHSYFPNKQERFILPVFAYFLILGNVGWQAFVEERPKWEKTSLWFYRIFWGLNGFLLLVVSPAYSKRSRVESMYYVGQQKDYSGVVIEYSVEDDSPMMPMFYADSWMSVTYITRKKTYGYGQIGHISHNNPDLRPKHLILFEPREVESRVAAFEEKYKVKLIYDTTIEPSYVDATLHWLNPNNSNETAYIYRIAYQE